MVEGMLLVSLENDGLLFLVESQYFHHDPFAFRDLLQLFAIGVEEVKVVIAVLLTLHDELAVIPWQELDGMLGLNVFLAGFAIKFCQFLTCRGIIGNQSAVVLVAIQFEHIDGLAVRPPADIREIAICGVASL